MKITQYFYIFSLSYNVAIYIFIHRFKLYFEEKIQKKIQKNETLKNNRIEPMQGHEAR